jgi:hypothetical protein
MITRWLIGAVAGLAALIGAYFYGVGDGKDHVRAEISASLDQAARAMRRAEQAISAARVAAARRESQRQQIVREVYHEIPTIVRGDPVYRNVCISDDGVRLLDKAAGAANGADPSGPAGDAAGSAEGGAVDGSGDGQTER